MAGLIVLHLFAAAGYAAAWRRASLFWPAAVLHAATLAAQHLTMPRFDLGMSLSVFMLLTAVVGWSQTRRPVSQTALLILAASGMLAPLLFATTKPLPPPAAWVHIVPAALAYSFAVLAMLQSMDLWHTERARRRLLEDSAPPVLTLEAACFRTLGRAFILLSLALVSGFIADSAQETAAHKIIFAALTWLTFGGLLLGRRIRGWRGRAARWWLAAGLLFFVLSYFGTHFVLQVLLGRST